MGVRYALSVLVVFPGALAACSGPVTPAGTQAAVASGSIGDAAIVGDAGEGGLSGAPASGVCSDGEVFAILRAECEAHVDLANAIRARLANPIALDFAEKVITDNSVLLVQISGEIRETGIAAASGGLDRAIAAEARSDIASLSDAGATVDGVYLDHETLVYLRDLGTMDHLLAPSARDPRVVDLVSRVRGVLTEDAVAATQTQTQLEGSCGSSGP